VTGRSPYRRTVRARLLGDEPGRLSSSGNLRHVLELDVQGEGRRTWRTQHDLSDAFELGNPGFRVGDTLELDVVRDTVVSIRSLRLPQRDPRS
jgi:hypothetical protein